MRFFIGADVQLNTKALDPLLADTPSWGPDESRTGEKYWQK